MNNNQNKNILNIIKTKLIAFLIIFISQIIALLLLTVLFSKFFEEINIRAIILLIPLILFIIVDIVFYKMHISRAKYFLNTPPIECIIEDFVLVSYGYTEDSQGFRRRDYRLYPIVKANNQLFFTYDDYCISHYTQTYIRINNTYTDIAIFRKDKSKVNIGDRAYLYIKKKIEVNVDLDLDKNTFKLNKQIEHFNNFNKNYDINIMKNLSFFEGIIDIEPMQ